MAELAAAALKALFHFLADVLPDQWKGWRFFLIIAGLCLLTSATLTYVMLKGR